MAPGGSPYAKDEKALCFHGDLLYEAKILEVRPMAAEDKKGQYEYRVHYKGWKNTWDDWVPQDRLRKLTEENKEVARVLRSEAEEINRKSKPLSVSHKRKGGPGGSARGSEERQSSVAARSGREKRLRDYETEKEEAFLTRPAVRIHVPENLKSLLVDDWENVTKNLQLVSLPAKTPAAFIVDEYCAQESAKRPDGSADEELLEEVVAGVKEYFDKCLGRILLYKFEREQFSEFHTRMQNPTHDLAGKKPSEVYGGEHLLRLFVSLPELIAQTNMDDQSLGRLKAELTTMMMWLSKEENIQRYFSVAYEPTSEEYISKAKN